MHPRRNSITICAGADKEIADKICAIVGGTLTPKQERTMYRGAYRPYWNVYLNSVRLWLELRTAFGLHPDKGLTMRFPWLRQEDIPHFVRGLTDSDGCWDCSRKLPRWRYSCGSIAFVTAFGHGIELQTGVRLHPPYHDSRGSGGYSLECTGAKALALGAWMYADSCFEIRCERKFIRWSEVSAWQPLTYEQKCKRRHEIAMLIPPEQRVRQARHAALSRIYP
jgi:hypothetical protein